MSGADWDSFFAQHGDGATEIDLTAVSADDLAVVFERMDDAEIDELTARLGELARDERDRRKFLAGVLSTLSTIGEVTLRVVRA